VREVESGEANPVPAWAVETGGEKQSLCNQVTMEGFSENIGLIGGGMVSVEM
jgi:hypothetical protein